MGEGELGLGPHLTQCGQGRGIPACQLAKFHLDPSNRLATVHERHRQTDRQDRTDRQRSDSIGRTVLQTLAKKYWQYFIAHTFLNSISTTLVDGVANWDDYGNNR